MDELVECDLRGARLEDGDLSGSSLRRVQDRAGLATPRGLPIDECLLIVVTEEWEHRNFAERDLDALGAAPTN